MTDDEFIARLAAYLKRFNQGSQPVIPLFKNWDGSINHEKTLALACYAEFQLEQ